MTTTWHFSDLRAGVTVEQFRAIDYEIATGVYPDMTEHGWDRDDWPAILEHVIGADMLVLLSPIWLGEKSSVCTRVIERLYGNSHLLTTFMTWNLLHVARMLKDRGGIPAHGNQRSEWDAG